MDPSSLQSVSDLCFSASSFWVVTSVCSTLVAAITSLFGFLMLSYRSRIQSAEHREKEAYDDRDEAIQERNEALWRLEETRAHYGQFAVEVSQRLSSRKSASRRRTLPPGSPGGARS